MKRKCAEVVAANGEISGSGKLYKRDVSGYLISIATSTGDCGASEGAERWYSNVLYRKKDFVLLLENYRMRQRKERA